MTEPQQPTHPARGIPLYWQVLLGVVLGTLLGLVVGKEPFLGGFGTASLGPLGMLVIRALKALAIPLVFLAILDAFCHTRISGKSGLRLVMICLVNVTVAMTIGLTLMNLLHPGRRWAGHLDELAQAAGIDLKATAPGAATPTATPTLDPLKNLQGYIPESLLDPFLKNNIIGVVLIAILLGAALRHVKERRAREAGVADLPNPVEQSVHTLYEIVLQALTWVIRAIPVAVFCVVAEVVGRSGLRVFSILGLFVAVILTGMALHALVYYPLVAWWVGKRSPRDYLGKGADAITTGLSTNSSLATVPITLRCLERLGVSPESSRLAACVGTNLNNDGITLYEAMAALFLAEAVGMQLGVGQQIEVVLASIMAGIGVAGVPEVGLIVLPLVLAAAGLPEALVQAAIPLILPVDWIIARARSGVNVMSDMLVAILLDATRSPAERQPDGGS